MHVSHGWCGLNAVRGSVGSKKLPAGPSAARSSTPAAERWPTTWAPMIQMRPTPTRPATAISSKPVQMCHFPLEIICIYVYTTTTTSASCVNSTSLDRIVAHTSIVVCRFTSRHKAPSRQSQTPSVSKPRPSFLFPGHTCAKIQLLPPCSVLRAPCSLLPAPCSPDSRLLSARGGIRDRSRR